MKGRFGTSVSAGAISVLLLTGSAAAGAEDQEFNLSCEPGEVLAGISGQQGWWMGAIAARCRSVQADGTLAAVRTTAYRGGSEAPVRTFDCGPGEVMVGYHGMQGDNGYVLYVHEVLCAAWQADRRVAASAARVVPAFERRAGAGTPVADRCEQGRVGTRVRGRAGQYLTRLMDIGCSHPSAADGFPGRWTNEGS